MATRNRPWSSLLSSNGSSWPSRVTVMSSGSRRAFASFVVHAVPEPEDAVLAVDREVDGDRLGDLQVAVLGDVEVRDVRRDRGVLVVRRRLAVPEEQRRDRQQRGDDRHADRVADDPSHERDSSGLAGCAVSVRAGTLRGDDARSSTRPPGFWRELPREGRMLLSIIVIEFFGTGLVLPFQVVYLHEVREFALSDVGLMLGLSPLIGLLVVGPGGLAIDRLGARRIILLVLSLNIVEQHRPRLRRVGVAGGARAGAAGHRLRAVVAGLPEPDRRGRAERPAAALLRRQLHPAQPRHRHRRRRRRLLRRRRPGRDLPGDLRRRRG